MRLTLSTALAFFVASFSHAHLSAAVFFSGSGNNPEAAANASGEASFAISGNTLTVVLTNTTSPRTAAQGNALSGIAFDIDSASPTLSLTNTALTSGSAIWTSKTASNTSDPLSGSWTDVLGSTPPASYGVSTSGFNSRFNGGSISLGNSSPDYGIVAAGTFDGSNVSFAGSKFPFIQKSLTFTFSGIAGISESQISNVQFLFGTDGTGLVTSTVPEPHAVFLLLLGTTVLCATSRVALRPMSKFA
ncbi:MAG TPA: XDD4 family exosortase-dependent surface protein [Lacipirellulaceae bacterium]|nr:XDD4 family exosortase-dependent surface protein [Lacipirellulaceae bacterium]